MNEISEYTGDYNQLVYLRARYYAPGMGRFLTMDKWNGHATQPMSINKWNYVNGNPINLIDPSGYESCSQQFRYCKIVDGPYEGFFIDVDHWADGKNRSQNINDTLQRLKGKLVAKFSENEMIANVFPYSRNYFTSLPSDTSNTLLDEITLGILVDYEVGLESVEGWDPACHQSDWTTNWPKENHLCSSFSNEDLPSIYLGYVAYKNAWNLKDIASKFVENVETDTEGTDNFPKSIIERFAEARNYCITPRLLDHITGQYKNYSWPAGIPMYPMNEPGKYWWPDYMVGY